MCYPDKVMIGGKHLLLLAVFVLLSRCQQTPKVSMSPTFKEIYSGDFIYLNCDGASSGSTVKWYHENKEQNVSVKTLEIAVASPETSGNYQCESNGQKSDNLNIDVLGSSPSANLSMSTGHPVMQTGSSVILQIVNEDGLRGWNCWVYRKPGTINKIKIRLDNSTTWVFQTMSLKASESIFWCTDSTQQKRSNQIIVRTSDREISLEMYPLPAIAGEELILRCLVWGTNEIRNTVFYKDNIIIDQGRNPTYKISDVTDSTHGKYKCSASYTHKGYSTGRPLQKVSDIQQVFVQAPRIMAVISATNGLTCSCPKCQPNSSYHWYYKNDTNWVKMDITSNPMTPKATGTYACRAVWLNKRSFISNSQYYAGGKPFVTIGVVVVVLMLLLMIGLAVFYKFYKRNTTSPIYEDMPMNLRAAGGEKYETLQMAQGVQGGDEYDTLHPGAPGGEKKKGEYEALQKEGMKEGVYHSLGTEGVAEGEEGYQALKKEGMQEGEYQSLGTEGAAGGEEGYPALKKEGMKEGEYHNLGTEGTE